MLLPFFSFSSIFSLFRAKIFQKCSFTQNRDQFQTIVKRSFETKIYFKKGDTVQTIQYADLAINTLKTNRQDNLINKKTQERILSDMESIKEVAQLLKIKSGQSHYKTPKIQK